MEFPLPRICPKEVSFKVGKHLKEDIQHSNVSNVGRSEATVMTN